MSPGLTCQAGHSSGLVVTPFTLHPSHPVSAMSLCHSVTNVWVPSSGHISATASTFLPDLQLHTDTALPSSASPYSLIPPAQQDSSGSGEQRMPSPALTSVTASLGTGSSAPGQPLPSGKPPGCSPSAGKVSQKGCTPDFQTRGCALLPSGTHGPVVEVPKKWQHPEPLSQVAAVAPPCPARAKGAPEPCRGTLPFTNP